MGKKKIPWNKGLTKDTDEGVARQSETLKKRYENGYITWNKGLKGVTVNLKKGKTKETDETLALISNTLKDRYRNGLTPWNKGLKGAQVSWNKGLTKDTNDSVAKVSIALKGIPKSEEHKRKVSVALTGREGYKLTPEQRIRRVMLFEGKTGSFTGHKHTPEAKIKISEVHKGKSRSSKDKQKIANTKKRQWEDREFALMMIKSFKLLPNKKENMLDDLLIEMFPNEFKYVGDGQFIIAGKCPDFININGKKQVIELYGDYWHRDDDPQERIDLFAGYGYKTLIIWEHELKDIDTLKDRLLEFVR